MLFSYYKVLSLKNGVFISSGFRGSFCSKPIVFLATKLKYCTCGSFESSVDVMTIASKLFEKKDCS